MTNRSLYPLFAALPLAVACAGEDQPFPELRNQGSHVSVAVWIQSDPLIPADAIIDACNEWDPLNLSCHQVASKDDAAIFVSLNGDECGNAVINGRQASTLMRAEGKRDLKMYGLCMAKKRERIPDDGDWYVWVRGHVKHEFGHLFGLRGHVPYFCDGTDDEPVIIHPSGVAICGEANMNASNYVPRATPLSIMDFLALDLRAEGFVLPRDPQPLFPTGTMGTAAQALTAPEADDGYVCDITEINEE